MNFSQSSTIYVIDTLSMIVSATINAGGTADTGMALVPTAPKSTAPSIAEWTDRSVPTFPPFELPQT